MTSENLLWSAEDIADMTNLPIENSSTIPSHWFTSQEIFQFEKLKIFEKSWQYVGPESQIPNTGDILAEEILGKPLLFIRGNNLKIRCFANVCRHRGGPLIRQPGVSASKVLRCAYHAWTYGLDGQLIGAPKFDGVQNFEKSKCQLPEFRVESYFGLLFVNFDSTAQPLSEYLSGVQEEIQPIDLTQMKYYRRVVYPVQCNWKVYVDNYMEGYHILPVHPGLAKILDVAGYKTSIAGNKVLQYGPLQSANNPYHTDGAAYYYQVFPNLMLNILPGRMQINSVLPLGVDRCATVFDFYYTETNPETLMKKAHDDQEVSDLVQQEDIGICELVQRGLLSGTYTKGRLSPQEELGVWAFQNNLRNAYKANMGKL